MTGRFSLYLFSNRFLVSAICEYNIPQKIAENGNLISGFKYAKIENTEWPPPTHLSGTGNVTACRWLQIKTMDNSVAMAI